MELSAEFAKFPGVSAVSAVMATHGNVALLHEAGMAPAATDAGPNDLLVVIRGEDPESLEKAFARIEEELDQGARKGPLTVGVELSAPRSIEMSLDATPANLALISVPGEYAAAEARKALRLGLHVMLFSANVAERDEVELKRYARAHDLIVMGPDCGTAIINGIPLGFANVVRRGDIGCVGASGTGLQQVTTLIDRAGGGVSQVIGTGGRDLTQAVGGISTLQGLQALNEDPTTRVVVLVSKPPDREVAARVVAEAAHANKPVVVNFLGDTLGALKAPNIFPVQTLEEAAQRAIALSNAAPFEQVCASRPGCGEPIAYESGGSASGQKYLRGLYSGGTLACEAVLLLNEVVGRVYHNTSINSRDRMANTWESQEHTVVDLGDPLLTRGRPHPMIDHRLRGERILREARDPEVAVILLDVVLGLGAHRDPASAIAPVIEEARQIAQRDGRELVLVGSVCGTAGDPQNALRQEATLADAGLILGSSNADAVRIAAGLIMAQGSSAGARESKR